MTLLEHVHELDAGDTLRRIERLKPEPRAGDTLHGSMILFHDIVEILHLTDDDRSARLIIITPDGRGIGFAPNQS
jgi:hypothetical protein